MVIVTLMIVTTDFVYEYGTHYGGICGTLPLCYTHRVRLCTLEKLRFGNY